MNPAQRMAAVHLTTTLYQFAHNWDWHNIEEMFATSQLGASHFKEKLQSPQGDPVSKLVGLYLGLDAFHQQLFTEYVFAKFL
jgi:hypothetical protein